jgi:hypothetical protein
MQKKTLTKNFFDVFDVEPIPFPEAEKSFNK